MKYPLEKRLEVIKAYVKDEISKQTAAQLLRCSIRTIERHTNAFIAFGQEGLKDNRHSNNYKLTLEQKDAVIVLKKNDRWRSGRNVRDKLKLPVHRKTINNIFQKEGLSKENKKRVKAIIRFEAESPNDLWQTDIMGKIERFWGFVQDDFVPEVINAKTVEEVNGAWKLWLARYNYVFKSEYFGNITRISKYHPSEIRLSQIELQTLLTVEERRKVSRESTISLYGRRYMIPPGYIGCRIWVKIKGNKLSFEANGEVFWKEKLKE